MIVMDSLCCTAPVHRAENCRKNYRTTLGQWVFVWSFGYCAFPANAAPAAAAPAADGGMLQVMLGLGLVLAVIAGAAWLLRRFGGMPRGPANAIRVIGGSSVGQRERVVLVEVADTWLVIGVAPGHVTALHSMPKGENVALNDPTDRAAGIDARFPIWLRQVMEKRNEK
ncbi:flagellar protein FliO/FliZ [Nitrosospira sp. Nsp5]|uniref:Flagellar protein n=2 Tax=Nitrosomonadaceae TaxID=206379 RepID=A0ABY0TE86_9PROT|nr:flagellar protein FliO/FliZ [Nitrosospira sp. Nsp5]SDQ69744.1 flagellar protein FliO/FliZ [Nitrosospira multiformis]